MTRHVRRTALAYLLTALVTASCGGPKGPGRPEGPLYLQVEAVDGGAIELRSYRGRPVVLHVFTTWSLAAQNDIPQLVEAHEQLRERLAFIGLALDLDGHRLVAPWRSANQIEYLIATAGTNIASGISSLGKISAVPTTIVLAPDGTVAHWLARPLQNGELVPLLRGMLPRQ